MGVRELNKIDDIYYRKMKEKDPTHRLVVAYQYYYNSKMRGKGNPLNMSTYESIMSVEDQIEVAELSVFRLFEYEWE